MIKSLGAILVPALVGGLLLVGCENQRNKTTPETDKPSVASQALAQAQSVAGSSEPAKQVEVQKVTFEITGMTWMAAWPKAADKALKSLPWVKDVKIDGKQATVTMEKGHTAEELDEKLGKFGVANFAVAE